MHLILLEIWFKALLVQLPRNFAIVLSEFFLENRKYLYRVTGNAQILEKALFPKLKLTKDLN